MSPLVLSARAVPKAWAVVFAVVGVGVAAAPDAVAGFVGALARWLRLAGTVDAQGLLHALAVSLMAAITVAAWTGRALPALLVAKGTSTAAFCALAWTQGPAWLLAAGADAFVAVTLLIAAAVERPPALVGRLLASLGGKPDAEGAWARAWRFPRPLGPLYAVTTALVEWTAPLLLFGRPARASRLPPADFDALQERLLHHPAVPVRAAYMLLRAPTGGVGWPEPTPAPVSHPLAHAPRPRGERFDVLVIGSGAGGAPVAARLAEGGRAVAVVEAGGLVHPAASDVSVERHYLQQGTLVTDGGAPILAARALGGTTAINSGTCLRPLPERLAEWDAALGTALAAGALDRWLDEAEAALGVCTGDRALLDAGARAFEEGLRRLGRDGAFVLPRNAPGCRGEGACCFGCTSGAKQSTDRSFLPRAVAAGAQLWSGTRVLRLREDGDGVVVEVEGPEGRRTLRAARVVLAGGAFGTPELLRRSGLGGPRVGHGLRLHPATKVLARFPAPFRHGDGVPQGLGWRAEELPRATFEGMRVPPATLAPLLAVAGSRQRAWMESAERHASFGLMVHDRGEGRLSWPGGQVLPRYRAHPDDLADLLAGAKLIARAFLAAGAERVLLPLLGAANEVSAPDELDALTATGANVSYASFHPQGTAGMGRVVDADLRLSARVDVCDASVLPSSPGANPQLTLVALSLRLADRIGRGAP